MKSANKTPAKSRSKTAAYYLVHVVQRWSLLTLIGVTIVYWINMIAVVYAQFLLTTVKVSARDYDVQGTNDNINRTIDLLGGGVVRAAVMCLVMTLGMFAFARARRYDKKQAIDTVVTIVFCVFFTAFSQIIIKAFTARLQ